MKYRVRFGAAKAVEKHHPAADAAKVSVKEDRLLRQIALGVAIERAVAAGKVASYAEAARMLGVSRVRVMRIVYFARAGINYLSQAMDTSISASTVRTQ